jgi:hypothetical protein
MGRAPRSVATAVTATVATGALAVVPGVTTAHDVTGSRFQAPVPLDLLLVGAAATVGATGLWLARREHEPVPEGDRQILTVPALPARLLRGAAAGLFLAAVVGVLWAGFTGRQVVTDNVATVFTWPVWFRGVALLAVLAGTPWRTLAPWRTVYRGLCRLEGGRVALRSYPAWGAWPALAGLLLLVGVVGTLTVVPRSPRLTAVVVAGYTLAMVGGAVLFGPTWFDRADPLGVLYRLFGRVAAVSVGRTGAGKMTVTLRRPWAACQRGVGGPALVVFVVAAVYTVSFDGFTNTRLYQTLLFGTRETLGTGPATSIGLYAVGLVAFVVVFVAAVAAGDRLAGGAPLAAGLRGFAPTVVPIAAAYEVAHNYPYVLRSTARLAELAGGVALPDPLGWLPLSAFWATQVALVVAGHVVAVVAAHGVAVTRYGPAGARRGHRPLLAVMVAYTLISLWVVSAPIVG